MRDIIIINNYYNHKQKSFIEGVWFNILSQTWKVVALFLFNLLLSWLLPGIKTIAFETLQYILRS